MLVYVLLIEDVDGETEECRTFYQRDSACKMLEFWCEENGISLDVDESDASIYLEEDEADGEEYVKRVDSGDIGSCRIIISELED